jgi:hypothetical protein
MFESITLLIVIVILFISLMFYIINYCKLRDFVKYNNLQNNYQDYIKTKWRKK